MADTTDDWMNPTPFRWDHKEPEPETVEYLIERQRKLTTFGFPGFITQWDLWSKHYMAEARDAEYDKLRANHPAWSIRKRDSHPWMEKLGLYAR